MSGGVIVIFVLSQVGSVIGVGVSIVVRLGMICIFIIRELLVLGVVIGVVVVRLLTLLVVGMLGVGMLMLGVLVHGRFRAQKGRAYLGYGLYPCGLLGEQNAREWVVRFGRVAPRQKGVGQKEC